MFQWLIKQVSGGPDGTRIVPALLYVLLRTCKYLIPRKLAKLEGHRHGRKGLCVDTFADTGKSGLIVQRVKTTGVTVRHSPFINQLLAFLFPNIGRRFD